MEKKNCEIEIQTALANPFAYYLGCIMRDDAMFIGRDDLIDLLITRIKAQRANRCVAIYGQTRVGKTSLLYHLKKRLVNNYPQFAVVLDIGNIGELLSCRNFTTGFIYKIIYKLRGVITTHEDIASAMQDYAIDDILNNLKSDDSQAIWMFDQFMYKIDSTLQKLNKNLVLIIDEFTYLNPLLKENVISFEFLRLWKALLQNHCIFVVVAGQDDMPEFISEYPNEFAAMELIKLNYLDEADTKKLIRIPLMNANGGRDVFADNDSVDELYKLTAGSAYLTIILCSNLVKYINEKGAYIVTRGIVEDFLRTKAFGDSTFLDEAYFEPQLLERGHNELQAENKLILTQIARLSQGTGYAQITDIDCNNLSAERIQELVSRLCERDVLIKEGRDRYKIKVKLFERWLLLSEI